MAFSAEGMEAVFGGGGGEDPGGAVAVCEKVEGDSSVESDSGDKRRTWSRILEPVGVTFTELDVFVGCGGVEAASDIAFDLVDAADGETAPTSGLEALPASLGFNCEGVVVLLSFAMDVLVVLSVGGVETLVDFWRMVTFWADSAFSATLDSDTTFFGRPLFFTTSDDIFAIL